MMHRFFDERIHSVHSSHIITEDQKPYLIAEIGINHNRDVELAIEMIEAASEAGANAVKFQSYSIDQFISSGASEARELYQIFKNLELDFEDHITLAEVAKRRHIDFISTPLSVDWVAKLDELRVPFFKIASGDVNNFQLLMEVASRKQPVIISTGNTQWRDIERAADFMRYQGKKNVIFMHCISAYPTDPADANLVTIRQIKERLGVIAGFSDHTEGTQAAPIAVAMGASVIEKHFTSDRNLPGPDQAMSIDPEGFKELRQRVDEVFEMMGSPREEPFESESPGQLLGKRSLYEVKGHITALRPRQRQSPEDSEYLDVLHQKNTETLKS